jgi:hypothetical protein
LRVEGKEVVKDKDGNIILEKDIDPIESKIVVSELPLQLEIENINPDLIENVLYDSENGQILVKFVKDWIAQTQISLFRLDDIENGTIEMIESTNDIIELNISDDGKVVMIVKKDPMKEDFSIQNQIGTIVIKMADGSERKIPVVLSEKVSSVYAVDKAPEIFVENTIINIEA